MANKKERSSFCQNGMRELLSFVFPKEISGFADYFSATLKDFSTSVMTSLSSRNSQPRAI